jgi:uncharacterized OsmC-like protein
MNRERFKAMQAPCKETYRRDPKAAVLTMHAEGRISADLAFTVQTPRGAVEAGLHPAAGGDGTLACAEEMLLETLVACSGVTLLAAASSFGIDLRDARVVAEGDIDMRGTLAIAQDVPVGFREIRLRFELDSDAPDEKLDRLIEATERYCVVLQTLRQPTSVRSTRVRLAPAGVR